jgi:predicted dehydrogenase
MCAFNYRFMPATRLARQLIEQGEIGDIYHFRARYLQEWIIDPGFDLVWRLQKDTAGSGALGDLGAHIIDLARFLVGEVDAVSALMKTFVPERPGGIVDVDDAFEAIVEFACGAVGTLEASRFCQGRKNALTWELNGSKGSMAFDLERPNELQIHLVGSQPGGVAQGFRQVIVSESHHPFWKHWWPQGHLLGWEHAIIHELHHFLSAIAGQSEVRPYGADFEDGYRAAEVCEAIARSATTGQREPVRYRSL